MVLKFIRGFSHNTGTVHYRVEVCMRGSRSLKVAGQVGHPAPSSCVPLVLPLLNFLSLSYTLLRCSALPHIVTKASDKFQNHTLIPTTEIGSLLFVLPWCILLVERSCLHCNDRKQSSTIRFKLWSHDHNGTDYKHACAERSVTILKICYGESADNF